MLKLANTFSLINVWSFIFALDICIVFAHLNLTFLQMFFEQLCLKLNVNVHIFRRVDVSITTNAMQVFV